MTTTRRSIRGRQLARNDEVLGLVDDQPLMPATVVRVTDTAPWVIVAFRWTNTYGHPRFGRRAVKKTDAFLKAGDVDA